MSTTNTTSSDQSLQSRIERERDFHDHRFGHNPSRSTALEGLTGPITLAALQVVYGAVKPWCNGAVVLDYGCAQGEGALLLKRFGAKFVHGIDISPVAVNQAAERATSAGVQDVAFQVMNAEALDFPDGTFDVVFGVGILHHLDIDRACHEIARVLNPTGVAVFLEPLAHNPMINLVRRLTPGARTDDEHPLRISDISLIRRHFKAVDMSFVNLLTLMSTPLRAGRGRNRIQDLLASGDRAIFNAVPWLRKFAWNVVITMRHPQATRQSS